MSLLGLLKRNGPTGFGYGSTAEDVTDGLDLTGKTYLLTGCNSGLGLETMRVLALRGASVVGAARSTEKAEAATSAVPGAVPVSCDLSEPESVRSCVAHVVEHIGPLDGIICNAGIMALQTRTVKHGHELQFLTNHIGHFILVTGLVERLTDDGRVVMLSSDGHNFAPRGGIQFDDLDFSKSYSPWVSYGQSKLANLLFARELARRFEGTGRRAYGVHPGVIKTNLSRHMPSWQDQFLGTVGALVINKDIPQGAATQTYAATHPDATESGAYWSDCNVAKSSRHGRDLALAARLWSETERFVASL